MQRVVGTIRNVGFLAIGAGIFNEFCLFDVDAGTRVVIFDAVKGVLPQVYDEGTKFKLPYQSVRTLDVRSRPRTINSASTTKDLQMVNVSLRVLYRPKPDMCAVIVKTIGMDYEAVVFGRTQDGVDGVGNEVLKEVVSFFTAEELLRSREQFVAAVRQKLAQKTQVHHIILDDVSVTHLSYGREYARAIESKQVAQQEAERQTYVVQKADQERLASIIRAEGEAEAAERISKAMKSAGNGLIEVRRIDTAKEVAALVSKSRGNITYLPGGDKSNVLLGVDNK